MALNVEARAAAVNRPILEVAELCKTYRTGERDLSVLSGVSLAIAQGETTKSYVPRNRGSVKSMWDSA